MDWIDIIFSTEVPEEFGDDGVGFALDYLNVQVDELQTLIKNIQSGKHDIIGVRTFQGDRYLNYPGASEDTDLS